MQTPKDDASKIVCRCDLIKQVYWSYDEENVKNKTIFWKKKEKVLANDSVLRPQNALEVFFFFKIQRLKIN